ncbi:MAG: hypothetical protein FD176_2879 [Rhodospirillaceae bacterium]|nr:MAG: hypothetical protein FD176_2879 [Rhodospirillaceae bacterium]TNC93771.1 MAG: hypothetical protein FD119_3755 [Stygiobacter sp.]
MHKTLKNANKQTRKHPHQEQKAKFELLLKARNSTPAQFAKALFPTGKPIPASVYRWCRGEVKPRTHHLDRVLTFFGINQDVWDSSLEVFRAKIPASMVNPLVSLSQVLNQQKLIEQNPDKVANEFRVLAGDFVAIRHSFNPAKGLIVSSFQISVDDTAAMFSHTEVTSLYKGVILTPQEGTYSFIGADIEESNPVTYLFDIGDSHGAVECLVGIQTGISKDFKRSVAAANIVLLRHDSVSWRDEIEQLRQAGGRAGMPKFIGFHDIPGRLQGLLTLPSPSLLLPLRHPSRMLSDFPG